MLTGKACCGQQYDLNFRETLVKHTLLRIDCDFTIAQIEVKIATSIRLTY